jgi:SMC interacting uncharacterized protein involved in chromosome segregation
MALTADERDEIILGLVDRLTPFMEEVRGNFRALGERVAAVEDGQRGLVAAINGMDRELRGEISRVRAEIGQIREELKAEIGQVREELRAEISQVREELKAQIRIFEDRIIRKLEKETGKINETIHELGASHYKLVRRVSDVEVKMGIKRSVDEV